VIEDFHTLRQTGLQKTPVLSDNSFIASFGGCLKTPFVKALSPLALDDAIPFVRPREEAAEPLQMHQKSSTPKSPLLVAPLLAAGSWFGQYLLRRPRTDLDDVIVNLCARSRDEVGNQLEAAVRTDALHVLDESPKRGPKLVFIEAGGGFLFIAFDLYGLSFLPTMSSRCIGRCPSELESVLDVDEMGLRAIEPVAASVVFDPGGISHNNDELEMRAVEPIAALASRLGKKGIESYRRCFLMLRRWKRSSSSAHLLLPLGTAYNQSAAPFTEVSVQRGGISLIYELGMLAVEPGPLSQRMVAEFLEAMVEKEAMEMRANWESKGIVTRRPLVLQLHKTDEDSEEYVEFLHLPKRHFTDFASFARRFKMKSIGLQERQHKYHLFLFISAFIHQMLST